jgi:hypothetical protein
VIQHILDFSKQLFFVFYDFPKLCGEDISDPGKPITGKYPRGARAYLGALSFAL